MAGVGRAPQAGLPPVHEDDEDDKFMMAGSPQTAGARSSFDPTRFPQTSPDASSFRDSEDFDRARLRATGTTVRDSRDSRYRDSQESGSFDYRNPRGAYGDVRASGNTAEDSGDSDLYYNAPRYRVEGVNYEDSGETYSEGDPRGRASGFSGSAFRDPDPRGSLASTTEYQRRPIDSQDSFDQRIASGSRATAPPAGKSGPHGGQRAPTTYSTDDSLEHDDVQLGTMPRGGRTAGAITAAAGRTHYDLEDSDGGDPAQVEKYKQKLLKGESDSDDDESTGALPPTQPSGFSEGVAKALAAARAAQAAAATGAKPAAAAPAAAAAAKPAAGPSAAAAKPAAGPSAAAPKPAAGPSAAAAKPPAGPPAGPPASATQPQPTTGWPGGKPPGPAVAAAQTPPPAAAFAGARPPPAGAGVGGGRGPEQAAAAGAGRGGGRAQQQRAPELHARSPGVAFGGLPEEETHEEADYSYDEFERDEAGRDGFERDGFEREEEEYDYGDYLPPLADYNDVGQWRPEEVVRWLDRVVGLPQYAAAFLGHEVDGVMLFGMAMENLKRDLGVLDAGHRRDIFDSIRALGVQFERGRLEPEILAAVQPRPPAVYDGVSDYNDVTQWRPKEVARWVDRVAGFPQYAAAFLRQNVDGAMLLGTTMVNLDRDLEVPSAAHRRDILERIHDLSDQFERGRLEPSVLKAVQPPPPPKEELPKDDPEEKDISPEERRRRIKEREAKKPVWERGRKPPRQKVDATDTRDVRLCKYQIGDRGRERVLRELERPPEGGKVVVCRPAKVGNTLTAPAVYINRATILRQEHVARMKEQARKRPRRAITEEEILEYFRKTRPNEFGNVTDASDFAFDRYLDTLYITKEKEMPNKTKVVDQDASGGFITLREANAIKEDKGEVNGVSRKLLAIYRLAKTQHAVEAVEGFVVKKKNEVDKVKAVLNDLAQKEAIIKETARDCERWLDENCKIKGFSERDIDDYASAVPLNLTPEQRYALKKMKNPRKMFALRSMLMANRSIVRMEEDKEAREKRAQARMLQPQLQKRSAAEEESAVLLRLCLGKAIYDEDSGTLMLDAFLHGNGLNLEPGYLQELWEMNPARRLRVTAAIVRKRALYDRPRGSEQPTKAELRSYRLVAEPEEEFFQRELLWDYPFESMLDAFLAENALSLAPDHVEEIRAFPHGKKIKAVATILRVGSFLGRVEADHRRRTRTKELLQRQPPRGRSPAPGRSPRPSRGASPAPAEDRDAPVEDEVKAWLSGPPLRAEATEAGVNGALDRADLGLQPHEVARIKALPLAKRARAVYEIANLEARVVEYFTGQMGWPRVDSERLDAFLQTFDLGLSSEHVARIRALRLDKRARAVYDLLKLDNFLKRMQTHTEIRNKRKAELEDRVASEEQAVYSFRPLLHRHLLLPLASKLTRGTLQAARTALLEQGRQPGEKRAHRRRRKKRSMEDELFEGIDKEKAALQKREDQLERLYGKKSRGRSRRGREGSSSGSDSRSLASSADTERFWYSDSSSDDSDRSDATAASRRRARRRRSRSKGRSRSRSKGRRHHDARSRSRSPRHDSRGRGRPHSREAGHAYEAGHVRKFISMGFDKEIDYGHIFPPDFSEAAAAAAERERERDRRRPRSRGRSPSPPHPGRPARAPPPLPSAADVAAADEFYSAGGGRDVAGLGPYTSDSRYEQVGAYSEVAAAREAAARAGLPGTRASMRGMHEVPHRKDALRVEYVPMKRKPPPPPSVSQAALTPRPSVRRPSAATPPPSAGTGSTPPRRISLAIPASSPAGASPRGPPSNRRASSFTPAGAPAPSPRVEKAMPSPRYDPTAAPSPRVSGGYDASRYAAAASPPKPPSPRRMSTPTIIPPSPRGAGAATAGSPRYNYTLGGPSASSSSLAAGSSPRPRSGGLQAVMESPRGEPARPVSASTGEELLKASRARTEAIKALSLRRP